MIDRKSPLIAAVIIVAITGSARAAQDGGTVPAQSAAPPASASTTTNVISGAQPTQASQPGPSPLIGAELTLKQAISIALKNHPEAKQAIAETNAAGERVDEARSLVGPQVFGTAQYLRSTDNGIGDTSFYNPEGIFPRITGRDHDLPSSSFAQSWDTSNNYVAGASFSQFLLDFGRRLGYVAQRRFEADAASGQQHLTDLNLIFEVSQRYFGLLQAKQMVRVYEKAVEERKFHLHEAQVKAKAGLRPELDVYVTEAEVQRAQLHLVDARNQRADAKVALDNALGLSDSAPAYEPADVLTYSSIKDTIESLLKTAFAMRPDLKLLNDEARAMGAQIREYRSDYFPTVTAVGGYAGTGTGTPAANNFNVGVVFTWPIFNSFLTNHQVAEATFEQHAIEHQYEDQRQRVILGVRTAFLNWQASLQRIDRAEKTLVASRAELELAEKRYEAGLSDIVELEDAQRHYTDDDAAYAQALYGYSVAKAAVDRATARSLQP